MKKSYPLHPPDEIKAGDSGCTDQTNSLSGQMSNIMNDSDSVVSEITMDSPLDGRLKKSADPSFYKNLVVNKQKQDNGDVLSDRTRRDPGLLPQESVGKLNGNDFLDGKFTSAFQKELSKEGLQRDGEGEEAATSRKQELMRKKLAMEYANRKRLLSNAKLDDLKENSLMDLFTSVNLAVDDVPKGKGKKRDHRPPHRTSQEVRRDKGHAITHEIAFDPNLVVSDDGSVDKVPNGVQKESCRQQQRTSAEIRERRQKAAAVGSERDVQFDPTDAEMNGVTYSPQHGGREKNTTRHRRHSSSPRRTRHHNNSHDDSRDIVFDPNEENPPDTKAPGFVPPPQISDFNASEVTANHQDDLVDLNISSNLQSNHAQRQSQQFKRHSSSSKRRPPATSKRQPPKDIPLSVTVLDDDSINGLSLVGIEAEIQGHENTDKRSRRRLSSSPHRRKPSRRMEESETPRRRRHHSSDRKRSKSKKHRDKDKGSSRRQHSDKERSRRSRSKHRASHHGRHVSEQDDESRRRRHSERKTNEKETSPTELKSANKYDPVHNAMDPVKEKEKKTLQEPSDDHVEILRKPINIRRTFSAPDLTSQDREAKPQDDEEEETASPVSENVIGLQHSSPSLSAKPTPKRGLLKRFSSRTSITRLIASLGNERVVHGPNDQQSRNESPTSPVSPSASLDASRGGCGSSKRSMSSSSSSDLSLRNSKGSSSERSLVSPVPSAQSQPQVITPIRARRNYTPTVVHESKQTLSYSERVMQGKIGISIPEGKTVEEFE